MLLSCSHHPCLAGKQSLASIRLLSSDKSVYEPSDVSLGVSWAGMTVL